MQFKTYKFHQLDGKDVQSMLSLLKNRETYKENLSNIVYENGEWWRILWPGSVKRPLCDETGQVIIQPVLVYAQQALVAASPAQLDFAPHLVCILRSYSKVPLLIVNWIFKNNFIEKLFKLGLKVRVYFTKFGLFQHFLLSNYMNEKVLHVHDPQESRKILNLIVLMHSIRN